MFRLLETRIVNYRVMLNGDKRITLEIQDPDIDGIDQDGILGLWQDKTCLVAVFKEYEEAHTDNEDEASQLRQKLGGLMSIYCTENHANPETETKRIYEKYGVTSRKELTLQQLRGEIDSYKAGLQHKQ